MNVKLGVGVFVGPVSHHVVVSAIIEPGKIVVIVSNEGDALWGPNEGQQIVRNLGGAQKKEIGVDHSE